MILSAALALALSAARAAEPAPAVIDKAALAEHIHKAFSTPAAMKLTVGELAPGPIPGWLNGTVEVADGDRRQNQPVLVSADGHWYFLGGAVELKDGAIPGFKALPDDPSLPPLNIFPDGKHAVVGQPKELGTDPDAANLAKIKLAGVPFTGPADAPLTIAEYSDLECPHCKRAHDLLETELKAYPAKVKRVFKHYPLTTVHPWAFDAAMAALCAAKAKPAAADGFRARFFAEQEKIAAPQLRAKAVEFAAALGVPAEPFARCIDAKETKAAVEADMKEGDSLAITGTPALFVNGRRVRGYQWAEVKAALDEFAPKKKP